MHRHLKRALGFTLSAAMAVSVLAVGASATEYTAPTTGVIANDSVLLGTSSSAGTTLLSMLGVNVAASGTSNGIIDNNTDSTEWGSGSQHLGIFGSDINDNPAPYLYNYFYNYNSTKSGGGTYSQEAYTAWNATPYSLIGAPSSTVTISIDGATKTCSPYFFYEPEIHVVMTTDPTSALAAYQESYNENYDPIIVQTGNTGNAARITGLPVNYNMFVMSERTVEVGRMVDELAETEGRMTRYANSAWEIASDYDKWCRGYYYWAQLMFEVHDGTLTDDEVAALEAYGVDIDALGGGLEKVRGIHSFSYDSDTDSWTIGIASSSGGSAQFAVGIVDDVYDVLTEEIATGVETDYVVTTAELIEYLTPEGNRPGVVVGNVSDSVRETLEDAGIRIISNLPSAVYGISTGSARERAIGQPYYLGFFYYDQLAAMTNVDMTLNPISMIFYWMKNFYHVSDNDAMQQVV
ncbi:MAG: hypothetical protein LUC40_04560, partial [Oscillospiraceae bacterium]|nr:hypothetical protein [Oscillospiraceae bacterium]